MSAPLGKTAAFVATIVVLAPIAVAGWYLAPLALPVWRWTNLSDWDAVAATLKIPRAKAEATYALVLRYAPRGASDPMPFQIMHSEPLYDPENDEEKHFVRVTLISDRSGESPGSLRLSSSGHYSDAYFTATAWRFPPGSFGFNRFRPLVVYDASTFDKVPKPKADGYEAERNEGKWTSDDEEVDDGTHMAPLTH